MEKQQNRILFFTGAGISKASGIKTFNEIPGIRERLSRKYAGEHPEEFRASLLEMMAMIENAEPNAAHRAIAELGCPVITMNVDGLHDRAGSREVIHCHGILPAREELYSSDFPDNIRSIALYGDPVPAYGEAMKLVKSLEYKNSCFIIAGTSFHTSITFELYKAAKQRRARLIIINREAENRVPSLIRDYITGIRPLPSFDTTACIAKYGL